MTLDRLCSHCRLRGHLFNPVIMRPSDSIDSRETVQVGQTARARQCACAKPHGSGVRRSSFLALNFHRRPNAHSLFVLCGESCSRMHYGVRPRHPSRLLRRSNLAWHVAGAQNNLSVWRNSIPPFLCARGSGSTARPARHGCTRANPSGSNGSFRKPGPTSSRPLTRGKVRHRGSHASPKLPDRSPFSGEIAPQPPRAPRRRLSMPAFSSGRSATAICDCVAHRFQPVLSRPCDLASNRRSCSGTVIGIRACERILVSGRDWLFHRWFRR